MNTITNSPAAVAMLRIADQELNSTINRQDVKSKPLLSFCHFCNVDTVSRYEHSAGHIENICNRCGTRRGINPYITKRKFEKLIELNIISRNGTPKGDSHDKTN